MSKVTCSIFIICIEDTRGKTRGLRPRNGSPTKHRLSLLLYVPPIKEIFEEIETWAIFHQLCKNTSKCHKCKEIKSAKTIFL